MSEQITVALPFVSLVVSLATLGWSVRLWRRQNEIEAEAAARDRLIAAGKVERHETPKQAVEVFRAARLLLEGKGGA